MQKRLTELQKGQIGINFMKMNSSPKRYEHYKRFLDNSGDIIIPGYHPITGKKYNESKFGNEFHTLS